jgi:hypothetical protein
VLRELAEGLLRYDAVTFLQLLDTLRLSEGRAAVWLLHSAAHTIFDYVRTPLTRLEVALWLVGMIWPGMIWPGAVAPRMLTALVGQKHALH